jgi:hypothetical protein
MTKRNEEIATFISSAKLPTAPRLKRGLAKPKDVLGDLPDKIVAGSNFIAFSEDSAPSIRSSVSQALLFAQLAADQSAKEKAVQTPAEWYAAYRDVLNRLGWREAEYAEVEKEFSIDHGSVHKAIIPFLIAAFGPAATVGGLIVTALQQLEKIDEKSKWIKLFERESKRLEVSDFQFTTVDTAGEDVAVKLAGAVLSSEYGRIQVLFFKFKGTESRFRLVKGAFAASTEQVTALNQQLTNRLADFVPAFIEKVDIGTI